jgi:predicted homoserine dehydrogenase-like protein
MYKPFHLIGLELNISILSAALRGEATGAPREFRGDAVAVAKRDLGVGDKLDGEGGYTVWGRLMPAAASVAAGALPIGLAHGVRVLRPVAGGAVLRWDDVEPIAGAAAAVRREMERAFAPDAALVQ